MKVQSKIAIILLITIMTLSVVSIFVASANASGNLNAQATISPKNSGVDQATTYTFSIANAGPGNLGAVNITIPSGYKKVNNLSIAPESASQGWNISLVNNYIILVGSNSGIATGQNVSFSVDATNPQVYGTYKWAIGLNENATASVLSTPETTIDVSTSIVINTIDAALIIFAIATGIAFINTLINRTLINYFVGWEQYRVMQKEMNEYRAETMAAARANDKKQVEKLKKRQSQINAMQSKMMKPQMVQFGISFVYIIVWIFVLTPTYGTTSLVYIPGIGPLSVVYWYPICSFFLGLLVSRIIGIMPIEP